MLCKVCGNEFYSKRKDAVFCSALCRKKYSRDVTDNVTDNSVTEEDVTDNYLTLKDMGIDLKDYGVIGYGEGVPVSIRGDITVQQVQGLVKIMRALKGDLAWEPRCGMGGSF
jgi:hypothetical protein